jgi:hypothetical protein
VQSGLSLNRAAAICPDMTKEAEATPLAGGGRTAVARRGGVVIRDTGPWARSVHSLLRHLHEVGFMGAPRVVGDGFDEQGREVLTYVEGEIINPAPGRTRPFTS